MRFQINLASQPYEDVRRFRSRWTMAILGLALITTVLAYAAAAAFVSWRTANEQNRQMSAQLAQNEREKDAILAALNRPENSALRSRADFLNTLISRKAFSWTEVLSDLERLVPPTLYVSSIHPGINKENQLEVQLTVAATDREAGVELVRRLEKSPHFMQARIDSEMVRKAVQNRLAPSKPPETVFSIRALYLPPFARTQSKSAASTQQLTAATETSNAGH